MERTPSQNSVDFEPDETRSNIGVIFEAALDAVIVMDGNGRILEFNPAAERIFGHRRNEVSGKTLSETIIPSEVRELHEQGLARYLATGHGPVLNQRIEVMALHANGKTFPVELSVTKMPGEGAPLFAGFIRDISERQRAEQSLRESQQLLKAIIDNSPAVIYVKATDGRYLMVNRRYSEIFEISPEAIVGKTDYDIFPKDAADQFRRIDQRVAESRQAIMEEEVAPLADGPHTYLSVKCPLLDDKDSPYAVFGISTDITERKRDEEAMRESEIRYRTMFDTLIEGFCTIDVIFDTDNNPIDFRFVEVNPAFERQTGLSNAQGHRMRELAPDLEEYWFQTYGRIALTGESMHFENEAKILGKHYDVCAYRIGNPEQRRVAILFNDVTERTRSERKLRSQIARLDLLSRTTRAIADRQDLGSIFQVVVRSLEEHMPIDFGCICLYDQILNSLSIAHVGILSPALADELIDDGKSRIDASENGLYKCLRGELVYEPDTVDVPFPFPQLLARHGLRSLVIAPLIVESSVFGVLITARKDPNDFSSSDCEFLRQLSEHVALAANQAQLHVALQDAYDELRHTQQTAMQQERLRALGQMASGIAHDINNAISPIALYTGSLLENETNLSERGRGYLETISHAVDDVAATVARLREFYRQREALLSSTPISVGQILPQIVELTRARWSDMPQQRGIVIKMHCDIETGLPIVLGVESEVREALTNLVFNAVDAMPEGGDLTLRGCIDPNNDKQVLIEVIDTGIGMDEDTRRRCLEPFFTTKGERGTGLGLAMVYGIVKRHDIEMEIESAVGLGTTIRLIFPVAKYDSIDISPKSTPLTVPRRRILLIDDDPILLKSLCDTLEIDGHQIVTANDGQAGLDALARESALGNPFSLVITDLGMPHMDGRKVAIAAKGIAPATPVILLTGWGQRLLAEGDVPSGVDVVLSKPPKLSDLREALRSLPSISSEF